MKKTTFTAKELSSESGVPQRTIRYYISRGLLSHPIRRGAKAEHDESHLKDLREIRELQKKGLTLDKISGILSFRRQGYFVDEKALEAAEGRSSDSEAQRLTEGKATWHAYEIAEDIVVLIKEGASTERVKSILAILNEGILKK